VARFVAHYGVTQQVIVRYHHGAVPTYSLTVVELDGFRSSTSMHGEAALKINGVHSVASALHKALQRDSGRQL
jgi:hypothetical protein